MTPFRPIVAIGDRQLSGSDIFNVSRGWVVNRLSIAAVH